MEGTGTRRVFSPHAVEVERERISDMNADLAEHTFCMRGTLLLHFGQQGQQPGEGREPASCIASRALRSLDRFGETEQRVR